MTANTFKRPESVLVHPHTRAIHLDRAAQHHLAPGVVGHEVVERQIEHPHAYLREGGAAIRHATDQFAARVDQVIAAMLERREDVFFYVTLMNENYAQPSMPMGAREGIVRGLYRLAVHAAPAPKGTVRLVGSGAILREVIAAAERLAGEWNVTAEVWSATSSPDRSIRTKSSLPARLQNSDDPS